VTYDDFELKCLVDTIQTLHARMGNSEELEADLEELFRELGHVMELLQLPMAAADCRRLSRQICVDVEECKTSLEEIKEERDKLLECHGVELLEELYDYVALPTDVPRKEAEAALKKLSKNNE
jgi:hypothetical protein